MKSTVALPVLALLLGSTMSDAMPVKLAPVGNSMSKVADEAAAAASKSFNLRLSANEAHLEGDVLKGPNPFSRNSSPLNSEHAQDREFRRLLDESLKERLRNGEIRPETPKGYKRVSTEQKDRTAVDQVPHVSAASIKSGGDAVEVKKPAGPFDQAMGFFTLQGALVGLGLAVHALVNNTQGYANVKNVKAISSAPAAGSAAPKVLG